jgi:cell division protein ZapA
MSELLPINILIGDRTYRVRVASQDEETVRKTVKLINDKILEFKTLFAGKDMQDYIAMVIVWYATQQTEGSGSWAEKQAPESFLTQMEGLLDKALR